MKLLFLFGFVTNLRNFNALECPEAIIKEPELEEEAEQPFSMNAEEALYVLETSVDREVKDRYVLSLMVVDDSTIPVRTGSIVILVSAYPLCMKVHPLEFDYSHCGT